MYAPSISFPRGILSDSSPTPIPTPNLTLRPRHPFYVLRKRPPLTLVPLPLPVREPPEVFASPVQSVHEWRAQDKAERDAGFTPPPRVLIHSFLCDICTVGVGKNHCETELYLYPLYKREECLGCTRRYFQLGYLTICGGCARRRMLPELFQVVSSRDWETRAIVTRAEIAPQVEALVALYFHALLLTYYHRVRTVPTPLPPSRGASAAPQREPIPIERAVERRAMTRPILKRPTCTRMLPQRMVAL